MMEEISREAIEKEAAWQAQNANPRNDCGATMGGPLGMAAKGGLRDRIHRKLMRASEERGQFERLTELEYLFKKHPEVARMLELIDGMSPLG